MKVIIQLHFRGYNIGIRLIDEFLAKSNVSRCVDFKETAEVIAKVCHIIWFISKTSILLFKCLKPGVLILVLLGPKVKLLTFKTHFACKATLFLLVCLSIIYYGFSCYRSALVTNSTPVYHLWPGSYGSIHY